LLELLRAKRRREEGRKGQEVGVEGEGKGEVSKIGRILPITVDVIRFIDTLLISIDSSSLTFAVDNLRYDLTSYAAHTLTASLQTDDDDDSPRRKRDRKSANRLAVRTGE
jgi:hypothetical protein